MAIRLNKVVSLFVLNQLFSPNVLCGKFYFKPIPKYRFNSSNPLIGKKLLIKEFGDPNKVVQLEEEIIEPPKIEQVLVKMLVAPVNPADINIIQGVYPVKPELPGVPGCEGVGEILAVGPMVGVLRAGDRVIPNIESAGTWRSYIHFDQEDVLKVPEEPDLVSHAGITVNPSTAYRMLKDFEHLKRGDAIIQNGANSAVGQYVIQLCKFWGLVSINVVRDRPDIAKLKEYLQSLGADHVITEEELRISPIPKTLKPKLGLNCVGGKSALGVMRSLASGGTMVTYGGMSREPLTIPTSSFIFNNIKLKGFWMTRWHGQNRFSLDQLAMFEDLAQYMGNGTIKPPAHKLVSIDDYRTAIMNTMTVKGFTGVKYYIDFSL